MTAIAASTSASQQQHLDDLIKSVEQHHQQYIRSLRSLHDGIIPRRRDRADSRNTVSGITATGHPPAAHQPLLTSSSSFPAIEPAYYIRADGGGRRPRRDTLETPAERPSFFPSPRPLPLTPNPNNDSAVFGGFASLPADADLSFIPLLEGAATSPSASASGPSPARPPASQPEETTDCTPRARTPLAPLSFHDDTLLRHIRDHDFPEYVSATLSEALRRRDEIDLALSFRDFAAYEREDGWASAATFEAYDVAADGSARNADLDGDAAAAATTPVRVPGDVPFETPLDLVDAPIVWDTIKDVNLDGDSVGRITIVQEPSPLTLAALHLAMSPHFDMSELLHHFLSDKPNRGRTHAFMHRAFERVSHTSFYPFSPPSPATAAPAATTTTGVPSSLGDPSPTSPASLLRQRSFFFVFKYYTVVGADVEPAPWQRYDKRPLDMRIGDHIDIAECGSVLALSLGGEPTKKLRMRNRRERPRDGFLFDTFGPWHLLSIQSFPDDQHTVRTDEFQRKSFYNGPYAFLELLVAEYRDAVKRNLTLHDRITKLITPPAEFMFDRHVRDKLLFEDKHFTYIRRYFWAYNTLAVINEGIKAMIAAYKDTFTDDFWAGSHPLLWPVADADVEQNVASAAAASVGGGVAAAAPASASAPAPAPAPAHAEPRAESPAAAYRDRMAILRRELDKVTAELSEVLRRNERTRKEIENLRDQLFSGSSIKESRRAIDQGDNIRILTMISMIFLPLTFVTSVFGITEFSIPASDWRFALTMILVCVPFMVLVLLLQTRAFTRLLAKLSSAGRRLLALPGALYARWSEPDVQDNWSTAPPATASSRRRRRLLSATDDPTSMARRVKSWWSWGRSRGGQSRGIGDDVNVVKV